MKRTDRKAFKAVVEQFSPEIAKVATRARKLVLDRVPAPQPV